MSNEYNEYVEGSLVDGKGAIIFIAIIALVVILGYLSLQKRIPIEATKRLVESEASILIRNFKEMDSHDFKKDAWDNDLFYDIKLKEEVTIIVVRSYGPDGEDGTRDDIEKVRTDYNKSLIIGRAIGSKSKEVARGIWEGIKAPRKHEVPDKE